MRKLTYTLLGEGYAEYAFLKKYLERVSVLNQIQAVSSGLVLPNGSKAKVYKHLEEFYISTFLDKEADLFMAGVDLDEADFELDKFNAEVSKLETGLGKLYKQYEKNTILFVPIQAIDYWILYQKYKIDKSTKLTNNSLEAKNKVDVKRDLYNTTLPNRQGIERISIQIAEKADFEELGKQSKSFNLFHSQIKNFMENF